MVNPPPQLIRVVTRRKLNGVGTHFGIHVRMGSREFYVDPQRVPGADEMQAIVTDRSGFAQGRTLTERAAVAAEQLGAAWERLQHFLSTRWKYSVTDQNCEHATNWVVQGKTSSGQADAIKFTVAVGGIVLAVRLIDELLAKPKRPKRRR